MDQRGPAKTDGVNSGRHERKCKVCSHPQRNEIEEEFLRWKNPAKIAKDYGLANRSSVYRHADAMGLSPRRARNIQAALEKIIEQVDDVKVNAAAVIQAAAALARLNSRGQFVDPSQQVTWNDVFQSMTEEELDEYAKDSSIPVRFSQALIATPLNSPKAKQNG